jgi:hypothetical protein
MKRNLFLLCLVVFLSGCAFYSPRPTSEILAQVDDIMTGLDSSRPAILELNGKPALLYAAKDGRITFKHNERLQHLDETAPVRGGNRFQIQLQDNQLHALWWSHQDAKNLYITSSVDAGVHFSKVAIVNDANGILPPYSIVRGAEGVIGIAYHDERDPNYQVYFNRSTDYGRTWARPDLRLDTPPAEKRSSDVQEPQSVEVGSTWISAWADTAINEGRAVYRIVSRRSEDAGLTWSPPEILFSADHHISSLMVRSNGSSIVIAADELTRGIFALTSQNAGRNWKNTGILPKTSGVSNSSLDLALAGNRAHLVWTEEPSKVKPRIMQASLNVEQAQWIGPAQRLDTKSYDNTRSWVPAIQATRKGILIAAWVDYRDIRPNIYLATSIDQGQQWSEPKPLLKPGEHSAGWPQIMPWGDQTAIAYQVYRNDRTTDGQFILRTISVDEKSGSLIGLASQTIFTDAARKVKLEQRIKTLWDARVAGDYQNDYDVFDFAFKANTARKNYGEGLGVIKYLSYAVSDIAIEGNEANIKMKIGYEIPTTVLPYTGQKLTLQPTEVDALAKWVWVGSDWYLVYTPTMGSSPLEY